jgi:multidrug efflux pump
MQAMEEIAQKLPPGYAFEWSGTSFEERLAGAQAPILFALSLLVVFLALSALYESWSIPFAVILVVPLGILGAVLAVHLRGLPNDVFFKVGLIASSDSPPRTRSSSSNSLASSTMTAWSCGRHAGSVPVALRPILMTSFAFILGVSPSRSPPVPARPAAASHGRDRRHDRRHGARDFPVPVFFVVVRKFFCPASEGNET